MTTVVTFPELFLPGMSVNSSDGSHRIAPDRTGSHRTHGANRTAKQLIMGEEAGHPGEPEVKRRQRSLDMDRGSLTSAGSADDGHREGCSPSVTDSSGYTSDNGFRTHCWNTEQLTGCYGIDDSKACKRMLAACEVCGDKAHGKFFGANVCLPCKTFFIRCTTEDLSNFICRRGDGGCDITCETRSRCKFCRYKRCLQRGMNRRERPETVDATDGQLLCAVCCDIANGVHFGVVSCEGCKKFFRRGLREFDTYSCRDGSNCVINPRTRNECRYCRFYKCVRAGMSRNAIKMGRPRKSSVARHSARRVDAPPAVANYHQPPYLIYYPPPIQSAGIPSRTTRTPTTESPEYSTPAAPCNVVNERVRFMEGSTRKRDCQSSLSERLLKGYERMVRNFSTQPEQQIDSQDLPEMMKTCQRRLVHHVMSVVPFVQLLPGFSSLAKDDQFHLLHGSTMQICTLVIAYNRSLTAVDNTHHPQATFVDLPFPNGHPLREFRDRLTDFAKTLAPMNLSRREVAVVCAVLAVSSEGVNVHNPEGCSAVKEMVLETMYLDLVVSSHQPAERHQLFTSVIQPKLKQLGLLYYKLSLTMDLI